MTVENIDLWVSAAGFESPYFRFYTDSSGSQELTELTLDTSKSYTFYRLNEETSHPFYISDSGYEQNSSDAILITGDGSPSNGITGNQSFKVEFAKSAADIEDLLYYCSSHQLMQGDIALDHNVNLLSSPSKPDLVPASDAGSSESDNLTNDTTPTFTGTAEVGGTVELFADGSFLGMTTSDSDGRWSITVPEGAALSDGTIAITATTSNSAGNRSISSQALNLTIDTTPPVFISTEVAAAIEENSCANYVIYTAETHDNLPVSYSLNPSNNDDSRSFSIDPLTGNVLLNENPDYEIKSSYSFTVAATDFAGNSSEQSVLLNILDINEKYLGNTDFPGIFNIAEMNQGEGVILYGKNAYDYSGEYVSEAGDINGDGYGDLLIGAKQADGGNWENGEAYIVFGSATLNLNIELSELDGSNGFQINGVSSDDHIGSAISSAGDINSDGLDDIIIGAKYAELYRESTSIYDRREEGEAYIIYGSRDPFNSVFELSSLDGQNGFTIRGRNEFDYLGIHVSDAGDINNDGIDDIVLGASGVDNSSNGGEGAAYVIFGDENGFNSNFDLLSLDGTNGFVLYGETDHFIGVHVSGAGDVNGDGIDDVLVAAPSADIGGAERVGEAYVVFGTSSGFSSTLSVLNLDGNNGFKIEGIGQDYRTAESISNAGDINADGFDDIIIGTAVIDAYNLESPGAAYVVFGSDEGFNANINLSSLDGGNGFRIAAMESGDLLGRSVSGIGDLNNDGIDDIAVGAYLADPDGFDRAGKTYIIYGRNYAFPENFSTCSLNGTNGFIVNGIDNLDFSGYSVSGAGDVNRDGIDDLIIGAHGGEPNGVLSGESYVIYGRSSENDTNNDNASPVFISPNTALSIDENSGANQLIYTALATDDSPLAYRLKLKNKDDAASFRIDPLSGEVLLIENPDYEKQSLYSFTVVATDSAGNTSKQGILLSINDIKERTTVNSILSLKQQDEISMFKLRKGFKVDGQKFKTAIVGTKNKDKIIGSSVGEIIVGFADKDVLKGGEGGDGFLFNQAGGFGSKNRDYIKDFDSNEGDILLFEKDVFDPGVEITLRSYRSKNKVKKAAKSKNDFVYDEKKGLLYFNENGKEKGWGDGGLFAKLQGVPELGAEDFTIV